MTREEIAWSLETLVLILANELPPPPRPDWSTEPEDVRAARWAYVKGLASGEIMRLRARLVDVPRGTSQTSVPDTESQT